MNAVLEVLRLCWLVVGTLAAVITLAGTAELLLITVGNLLPKRNHYAASSSGSLFRIAVVIPAHNEEASIGACVQSLQLARQASGETVLVVIADNCSDRTAEVAQNAGARVLIRNDKNLRGKGYALDHAFQKLLAEGFDAILIVDADTEVAPDFLLETGRMLQAGADAVQCKYLMKDSDESVRLRLRNLALRAWNIVRPRGRDHLGLSCGICGNGFGMRREVLEAVPYSAASVVEDLEYHLLLVRSGRRVSFVESTAVYAEIPVQAKAAATQRVRWEGGRFRMIREKTPELLFDILRGHFFSLEPMLELLLLPLAFHVALLLVALSTPWFPARLAAVIGLAMVLAHLVQTIFLGGNWREAIALLIAPLYILRKLLLLPALLKNSRTKTTWVRTERSGEK